jgi:hypothetical protein
MDTQAPGFIQNGSVSQWIAHLMGHQSIASADWDRQLAHLSERKAFQLPG